MTTSQKFHKFPTQEFYWNKYDNLVVGNNTPTVEILNGMKAKHLHFSIIPPSDINCISKLNEYYHKLDLLFEFLNKKYCVDDSSNNSSSGGHEKLVIQKDMTLLPIESMTSTSTTTTTNTTRTTNYHRNLASSNIISTTPSTTLASTFYPPSSIHQTTIQSLPTALLYHNIYKNISLPDQQQQQQQHQHFKLTKLMMRTNKHGPPNWLYCNYDSIVHSYKTFHLQLYWVVCDSWLVDDLVSLLYRRCLQWGLRLSQIPLYYHTENLSIHPYRALPFISIKAMYLHQKPHHQQQQQYHHHHIAYSHDSKAVMEMSTSSIRMIERIVFSRSNGWVFDGQYATDWEAINIMPYNSNRDRDIFQYQQSIIEKNLSDTGSSGKSNISANNDINIISNSNMSSDGGKKRNTMSALSQSLARTDISQRVEGLKSIQSASIRNQIKSSSPPPSSSSSSLSSSYDRQYIHQSGLVLVRIASNGFLWMHNSSSKISDLSMNIEEKKDIVARHMHMLENYCEEIFICYDILCNDVIEVVLKVIKESILLIERSSNRHDSSDSNSNIINCIDETNDVVGTKKGRDHNDKQRNDARNEGRHQRRDNDSQVLEPVVIGELVSTVAGALATDNEILNLPTAYVANIDEEDVLYVDLFVDV